jgi:hypothetical protein
LTSSGQNQYYFGKYHAEEDDKQNRSQDSKAGSIFTDNATNLVDGYALAQFKKDE